jgi:serine/threonine protein kinase
LVIAFHRRYDRANQPGAIFATCTFRTPSLTCTDPAATRYRNARSIVHRALEQTASARSAFIEAECGGDARLLAEVDWLLAAATDCEGDDAPSLLPLAQAVIPDLVEAPLPRNYRLLRRLGEGGMGVVHLAERIDGEVRQQVALKLLRIDASADPALARRFTTERRILAGLNHRNIARMVDGGITADGRPFLAMEYVDGERIDRWCQRHALPLTARIELFLQVCDAVEYAHRQLVIHRDLKPDNILVGADGELKLLDFGIARLLGDAAGEAGRTETGSRALTLAYASPEQIEGGNLGTATDIYSLGVVLYQLVAGTRPFDHLQSAHLLSNAIVSGEIAPPSRLAAAPDPEDGPDHEHSAGQDDAAPAAADGTSQPERSRNAGPGRLRRGRRIPADVDAIVLKAMRREPAQRYGSVTEFAADLRRFLESRPVLARRGHWFYRARRFTWRWRWAVAASLAFAVLLSGFILDREHQLRRTQLERDRAESLAGFMNDLFENADSVRSRGNEVTVRELLDRGAQELLARTDLDPALRRSMLLAMGRAYNALGLGQQSLPLLESATALLPDDIPPEERIDLLVELSEAHSSRRDTAASIAADARAIAMLSETGNPDRDEIVRLRIRMLHNHALLLDVPIADTRAQLHRIAELLSARPEPPDRLLIQVHRALTVAYSHEDTPEQAVAMAERTLAYAQRHYRPDDPRLLSNRFVHAMAIAQLDPAVAVALHEALIEDYERLIGPNLNLAAVWSNLGVTLSLLSRHDESLDAFQRSADMVQAVAGTGNPLYRTAIANIATHHSRHGDARRSLQYIDDILPALAADATGGTASAVAGFAGALKIRADAQVRLGRMLEAERTYRQAREAMQSTPDASFPVMGEILEGLATTYIALRRYQDARTALQDMDVLNASRNLQPDHPSRLPAATLWMELHNATGRFDTALRIADATADVACGASEPSLAWRERWIMARARGKRQTAGSATIITEDACGDPVTVAAGL